MSQMVSKLSLPFDISLGLCIQGAPKFTVALGPEISLTVPTSEIPYSWPKFH